MAETHLQVMQRILAGLMTGGAEGRAVVQALFDPNFVLIEPEGLPYGGTYHGPEGWWEAGRRITSTWSDLKLEPIFIKGDPDGEDFALFLKLSGRSAKTGTPFQTTVLEHWVVRKGKLVKIQPHYFDTKYLCDIN